ncbi:hypothetical protein DSECCO2_365440 [anaerobic digester metagenome]
MKRTILPFAIAAIAVVGIAVGLLLAGAGQTGPLQGGIAPSLTPMFPTTQEPGVRPLGHQTNLTLECTVINTYTKENHVFYYLNLHGRLIDQTGAPVASQMVRLDENSPDMHFFDFFTATTTGADGSFSAVQYTWADDSGKPSVYRATFAGSDLFLPSRSPDVMGPHV